jgi:hypothetical protein
MVFFFETLDPRYKIYMGKDKYENEELIKYGLPEDLWFHVDNFSSAHVYLRIPPNDSIDIIPELVLEDCCQLVKANSIEGNKVNNVTIVYTPWANLKKTNGMDVGQVGFHDPKQVKKYKVLKRKNDVVNRLNKTKEESYPDLKALRDSRDKLEREKSKEKLKEEKRKELEIMDEKKKQEELRNYSGIMKEENMMSNKMITKTAQEYEEDFF